MVAAWLGNTPKTAEKHYLQVTDADFQQATESGTESGTQNHDMAQKAAQHTHAYARTDSPEATQPLDGLGGYANRCDSRPGGANPQSGRGGIRTPGTLRYAGFQDRCIRPLCHPTGLAGNLPQP